MWWCTGRLDYHRLENRIVYMTLYRHIQNLGRRGACRAALEFSKLLLAVSPDTDPMCVLLFIDHYALRAKEYAVLTSRPPFFLPPCPPSEIVSAF